MIVTIDAKHLELHFNRACEVLSTFDDAYKELEEQQAERNRLYDLEAANQSWLSRIFFGKYERTWDEDLIYRLHVDDLRKREKSMQEYVRGLSDMLGSSLNSYTFDMRDL